MPPRLPPRQHPHTRAGVLWLLLYLAGAGCGCGEAPALWSSGGSTADEHALHSPPADANMRQASAEALERLLAGGGLQGRGIWQRGEARRKGAAPSVHVGDDADAGIIDGYSYHAYLSAPPPRIARAQQRCRAQRDLAACPDIDAYVHVALERVGGIAAATWRTDPLIAYRQQHQTYLCACPPSALTERLPLCCSALCCH